MPAGKITRTELHQLSDEQMWQLCRLSKNLYNRANYVIREYYASTGKYMSYYDVYDAVKSEECFTALASQAAQSVLRRVDKNWKSFFALRKKDDSVKIPKYKKKDGYFVWEYAGSKLSIKNGVLKIPKTNILIPVKSKYDKIVWLRIVPKNDKIVIEIVFEKKYENEYEKNMKIGKAIGIDIGVNNLATIASNEDGERSCLINGRPLKSINRYYNKKMSKLQSTCDKINRVKTSKKIRRTITKRNNKISDYMHKASRAVVKECTARGVETVVIGHNIGWKKKCNIGKRNNQNFCYMPTSKFIAMLRYKFEEYGIRVIEHEESYTSKCDHLLFEPMMHLEKRSGSRTYRGMFKSGSKITLNADVNGAYGILRKIKAVDERFFKSIIDIGHVVWPIKLSVKN